MAKPWASGVGGQGGSQEARRTWQARPMCVQKEGGALRGYQIPFHIPGSKAPSFPLPPTHHSPLVSRIQVDLSLKAGSKLPYFLT